MMFADNSLLGTLPEEIVTAHTGLELFDVHGGEISGTIPLCLANQTRLQVRRLSPLVRVTRAKVHSLDGLHLAGRAQVLYVDHNKLSGSLPAGFGEDLVDTRYLRLSHNVLSGTTPCCCCVGRASGA